MICNPQINEYRSSSMFAVRSALLRACREAPLCSGVGAASARPTIVPDFRTLGVPFPLLFGDHFSTSSPHVKETDHVSRQH